MNFATMVFVEDDQPNDQLLLHRRGPAAARARRPSIVHDPRGGQEIKVYRTKLCVGVAGAGANVDRLSQGRQGRQRGLPRHARRIGHDPGQRLHVPEPRRRRRHAARRRAVQVRVRRPPRLRARALLCRDLQRAADGARAAAAARTARAAHAAAAAGAPTSADAARAAARRRSSACARGHPPRTTRRPRGPTTAPTPSSTCTVSQPHLQTSHYSLLYTPPASNHRGFSCTGSGDTAATGFRAPFHKSVSQLSILTTARSMIDQGTYRSSACPVRVHKTHHPARGGQEQRGQTCSRASG